MNESDHCRHQRYSKEEIGQKWTGHATCMVLAQRKCLDCAYVQSDWEFGNHEGHPRMFQDETNFFTGEPFGFSAAKCLHENAILVRTGRARQRDHDGHPGDQIEYKVDCPDCKSKWTQWGHYFLVDGDSVYGKYVMLKVPSV